MKIVPNQRFIHDKEAYEEGQEYDVSDELAHYFTFAGWVGDKANGADTTLKVDDSLTTHESEVR